ncbi:hypothetical protein DUNSADRAFT_4886 [Dunaliella salina]|uniref:C2H2-type domain-containing protein n=1 Tax=Dunaliella salina TaxID=3046 RepID=A0ABQ7GR51_DUNSA|nr:hypothetical protein DUNSADRAFT_4886 [Dunaliella salina]|eukprot:KAF5837053.1 hypothetical protein DUNSADRAFT_4886 [Dunaliella salina]
MHVYACQACGKPCGAQFPCERCAALLYCSSKHRRLHRSHGGHDTEECNRMAQQVAAAPGLDAELASFFPWWPPELQSFLPLPDCKRQGLHPPCSHEQQQQQQQQQLQQQPQQRQWQQHTQQDIQQQQQQQQQQQHIEHQQQQDQLQHQQQRDQQQQQQQQQQPLGQLQCLNQDPVCQLLQHYGHCHMQGVWCALCPCTAKSKRAAFAEDQKSRQQQIAGSSDISSEDDLGEGDGGISQGLPWGAINPPTLLLQPPPPLLPYSLYATDPTTAAAVEINAAATMQGPCQAPHGTDPTASRNAHAAVCPAAAATPNALVAMDSATAAAHGAQTAVHPAATAAHSTHITEHAAAIAAHRLGELETQPPPSAPAGGTVVKELPASLYLPERDPRLRCSIAETSHLPAPAQLPKSLSVRLHDWASCYAKLGLQQQSLHALVLHFAATLAHTLQQLYQPAGFKEDGVDEAGAGCAALEEMQQKHGKEGLPSVQQQQQQQDPYMQQKDICSQHEDLHTQGANPPMQQLCKADAKEQQQQQPPPPSEQAGYTLVPQVLGGTRHLLPATQSHVQHVLYLGPQCELDMLDSFSALPHLCQPAYYPNSVPPSLASPTTQTHSCGLRSNYTTSSHVQMFESPAHLLPTSPPAPPQLHIHFIGPNVPLSWHGHSSSFAHAGVLGTHRATRNAAHGNSSTGKAHGAQPCASFGGRQAPDFTCVGQGQLCCSFWHGCLHDVIHEVGEACSAHLASQGRPNLDSNRAPPLHQDWQSVEGRLTTRRQASSSFMVHSQGHDLPCEDHWQARKQDGTGEHEPQHLTKQHRCSCSGEVFDLHHRQQQEQQQQQHVQADLSPTGPSLPSSGPFDTSVHPSKRARLAPPQQQQQQQQQQHSPGQPPSPEEPSTMSGMATPGCLHGQQGRGLAGAPLGNVAMVFAPNAGLAAYPSWLPTLQLLAVPGSPPLVVTDFCEEALVKSQLVQALLPNLRVVQPISPNPLRQPLRQTTHGNQLPAYSNGFSMVLHAEAASFNTGS